MRTAEEVSMPVGGVTPTSIESSATRRRVGIRVLTQIGYYL